MMKIQKRRTHKLSLSSETLRTLTVSQLARAQGGLGGSLSYCDAPDDNTVIHHTDGCQTLLVCWETRQA
jgi:hypothetical protein